MIISDYDMTWISSFNSIKAELIRTIFTFKRIEHIGSTSIPGMKAKPIIDIDVEIEGAKCFGLLKKELESIGYVHCGNQGINDREVFKRRENNVNLVLDNIKHHLYVCSSLSLEYKRHILFRNYLREHHEFVERYNKIKEDILKEYGIDNREKYVEIKESKYRWFFEEVLELCQKEKKEIIQQSLQADSAIVTVCAAR